MVIVDTSVWIDALRGNPSPQVVWLRSAVATPDVGLTSLVLCEILQGMTSDSQFRDFRQDLLQFPVFETGGVDLAIQSAQNYRTLRQKGFTIRRTIDCIIATFCIQNGYELLHNARDFDAFEQHLGLQVLNP